MCCPIFLLALVRVLYLDAHLGLQHFLFPSFFLFLVGHCGGGGRVSLWGQIPAANVIEERHSVVEDVCISCIFRNDLKNNIHSVFFKHLFLAAHSTCN